MLSIEELRELLITHVIGEPSDKRQCSTIWRCSKCGWLYTFYLPVAPPDVCTFCGARSFMERGTKELS